MIDKLKKIDRNFIESLVGQNFSRDLFIDEDILHKIAKISFDYNMEIAIVINRKNNVMSVSVGAFDQCNVEIGDYDGLSGIRVIHTHPNASEKLSEMDIAILKNKILDCMCAISVSARGIEKAMAGFFDGINVSFVKIENANYINKYDLLNKMALTNKEFLENKKNQLLEENGKNKAILVGVEIKNAHTEKDLEELESLADTAGIQVVGYVHQKRTTPDGKYFIGAGKMMDIQRELQLNNANLVIFDNELTASKQNNISNFLNVKVIDRSMLILDIFASRARSSEGKLQVELAQLKYSLPRLSALSKSSNRYGGGVGMRGPGETKLEIEKRVVENNILKKTEELKKLKQQRALNRQNRSKVPTVAIVGYTNSGKSTLLNTITKAGVYVKNQLFATLDVTARRVYLGDMQIILTDTVGFINNLPHEFIEAFASTLDECKYADLLLNVVDVSNPNYKSQMDITIKVLKDLGVTAPILNIYNKIDKATIKPSGENIIEISAKNNIGIDNLKNKIIEMLSQNK